MNNVDTYNDLYNGILFNYFMIMLFIIVVIILIWQNGSYLEENYENLTSASYSETPINNLYYDNYKNPTSSNNLVDGLNRITFPSKDDSVTYGDYVCVRRDVINQQTGIQMPNIQSTTTSEPTTILEKNKTSNVIVGDNNSDQNNMKCPNKSLNELHKSGAKYYDTKVCGQTYSNIQGDMNGMDPADFYKKNFIARRGILDDDKYRGFNYNEFVNNGSPSDVGRIPLYKTNDYPVGSNFVLK